ncbi:LacI family transcriptional regulator [Clostridiaceae bacterium]|nr:LacI family transcriptional regulator [Clostridiaceae bacterium]NBH78486.1 LacI family transcriptional regulator [Clostridiaceae bacterium]
MKTRPTIKDIANMVGVSATTVSYVLNQNTNHKISDATRDSILEAAYKLQYVPNGAARSLRYNSSHCISVALEKSLTNTRFGALLQGIRNGLRQEGYWLMLFDFDSAGSLYPDYLECVLQRRADGIIYISSDGSDPDPRWREAIVANSLPFVACDCCPPEPEIASISFDYERGAFEIGCRLFGEGAKRILYWRPDIQTDQERYREDGLRQAARLYPDSELSVATLPYGAAGDVLYQERYSAFSQICKQYLAQDIVPRIASFEPGDAVVCSWGIMVKHLSAVLSGGERRIKLASMSDAEAPVLPEPRILTSRPRFLHGGEACARLLMQQIRGEKPDNNRIVIAPETPQYMEL